jgi:plastocyanin
MRSRRALTSAGIVIVLLLLALGAVALVYISSTQSVADQVSSQSQQISLLKSRLDHLSGQFANLSLPVMNQPPTVRAISETWYLSPSAHQDRFDPAFVIVNQGDLVKMVLIDNDTVAHDLVIGPPYSIIINATVPGLVNDLTGQKFTTQSKNNSPGVVVTGKPGNVSASLGFIAKYSGIFEFVCTYHAQVGMIGYLVVLPNSAYTGRTSSVSTAGQAAKSVAVSIVPGAGVNTSSKGYSPGTLTVVVRANSTVVWTNNDSSPHTVTSNDGTFTSGNMSPGQTYSYTFAAPGTYTYHCTYHPWMVGTIVVVGVP